MLWGTNDKMTKRTQQTVEREREAERRILEEKQRTREREKVNAKKESAITVCVWWRVGSMVRQHVG